jgi:hypothetical protein
LVPAKVNINIARNVLRNIGTRYNAEVDYRVCYYLVDLSNSDCPQVRSCLSIIAAFQLQKLMHVLWRAGKLASARKLNRE